MNGGLNQTGLLLRSMEVFALAGVICFASTPLAIRLARRLRVIDLPGEHRRIHKQPTPLLGGVAIFTGCVCAILVFCKPDRNLVSILFGAAIVMLLGAADDKLQLGPWIKLLFQTAAVALPVVYGNVQIDRITNFFLPGGPQFINFGVFAIPITIIWIVVLSNAVNWIDGLDGLAVGVSAIAALCIFLVTIRLDDPVTPLIIAAIAGSCIGFMPFNFNPAKIFMGDSGALFLGYMLGIMSVQGMFKWYAAVSFAVPFLVLGLPLFDSVTLVMRRLAHGQSPFYGDRNHIHHRLIDLGLTQKQAVAILYSVSAILGLSAVVLNVDGELRALTLLVTVAIAVFAAVKLSVDSRRRKNNPPPADQNGRPNDNEK